VSSANPAIIPTRICGKRSHPRRCHGLIPRGRRPGTKTSS
jgi:hypothetical protein